VTVPLNQNQFDALVSFTENEGATSFEESTLLRLLNAGDYAGAAAQFDRWVYQKGRVLPGLVDRRQQEAALFNTPINT
jgi:lysozyme